MSTSVEHQVLVGNSISLTHPQYCWYGKSGFCLQMKGILQGTPTPAGPPVVLQLANGSFGFGLVGLVGFGLSPCVKKYDTNCKYAIKFQTLFYV